MLFGPATEWDQLPEDTLNILVSNGVGEAAWERMKKFDAMQATSFGKRPLGSRWYQALKAIGLTGVTAATIMKGISGNTGRTEGLGKGKKRSIDITDNERYKKYHKGEGKEQVDELPPLPAADQEEEDAWNEWMIDSEGDAANKELTSQLDKGMTSRPKPWWQDSTLQDRDHQWLHANDNMQVDSGPDGAPVQEARAANGGQGGSGGGGVSKETPVMLNATPSYGLQETHTTMCNFNGWFAAVGLDHASPLVTEMRLTAPLDCFGTSLTALADGGTWVKGLYNSPYNNGLTKDTAVSPTFPAVTPGGAYTAERANWFNYWANIYEYYTVLRCDYEIIISNANGSAGNGVLTGWDFNTYSDTAGATGNKTPQNATLIDMLGYKQMKWTKNKAIHATSPNQEISIISGSYFPGQAARNVSNDGDVKTWSLVTAQPTLKEFLTLYFFKDPLAFTKPTTGLPGCNVQYNLKYTVQFKDLKVNARYPTAGAANLVQTLEDDALQII